MVVFHRVVAYILAALLLVGGASLIAFVVVLPGPYTLTAYDGQQFSFTALSVAGKLATVAVGVLLFLVGVFLVAMEVLGPPARRFVPVTTAQKGSSAIARESVEQRLAYVLTQIPGVVQASPRIRAGRSGTAVDARLVTDADVPVAPLCEQAHDVMMTTLEHDLGLPPGLLRVYVRHDNRPGNKDSEAAVV